MSLIQEKFTSLFSNYEVSTAPRPDGGILLTLRSSDGKVFKRALSYQQLHAGDQLSWAISAIRRDLAEQASELPQIAMLAEPAAFCSADLSLAVIGFKQKQAVEHALHGLFLCAHDFFRSCGTLRSFDLDFMRKSKDRSLVSLDSSFRDACNGQNASGSIPVKLSTVTCPANSPPSRARPQVFMPADWAASSSSTMSDKNRISSASTPTAC